VFSYYKLYGPHISAMYVRHRALTQRVKSIVHAFLSPNVDGIGYKLQPAGPGYESTWGTTAIVPYIESLTAEGTLEAGFTTMKTHDAEIAKVLLRFLSADKQRKRGVKIVGSEEPGPDRMPTISFVVGTGDGGETALKSKMVVNMFDKRSTIGIRYGHFYAYYLIESLEPKIDPTDGVVRVSFVHYNTIEEVDAFTKTLADVLYN